MCVGVRIFVLVEINEQYTRTGEKQTDYWKAYEKRFIFRVS